MAYDVFISYSTKNLHIVDWAVKTLHQQGHIHVFAAEYSVQPSQVLNQQIELAIRNCDLFILLWSQDARASDYVPQEIGIAKGCNKVILPVVMEEGVPVVSAGIKRRQFSRFWSCQCRRFASEGTPQPCGPR